MRRIVLLGLFALVAVYAANDACAQRHGGGGMSAAAGGWHGSSGARPATVGHGSGFNRGRRGSSHRFHHGYQGYGNGMGYGYLPGDFDDDPDMPYDTGDAYPDESQPDDVLPPPPLVRPSARPVVEPAVHPVVTEYKWPAASPSESATGSAANSETAPRDFAIVLKNGSTLSAAVVFASSHWLHYVDPDDKHLRISMSEIDRTATLKINRARNLNLYLPAAQ